MSKRSKKKNPNPISAKERANIEFNAALDVQKSAWDKRLNITIAVVMCVIFACILLLPVFNMSFTRSLKDLLGDAADESAQDADMTMVTTLSFLDILTALAGGYEDSADYICSNNDSGLDKSIVDGVFRKYVTEEEIAQLDRAYYVALALAVALIVVYLAAIAVIAAYRSKGKDGVMLALFASLLSAMCIAQWIFFVVIGASAADKGQLQPHAGSYFLLFAGITLITVYGVYRSATAKIKRQYRPVEVRENTDAVS